MDIGMTFVVDVLLFVIRPKRLVQVVQRCRFGRIVAQQRIFHNKMRNIDTEAIYAALQPGAQHIEHGCHNLRIAPVQVGLLFQEAMQVVLSAGLIPFPGGAAKDAQPVVRRGAIRASIRPDVPIAPRADA